MPLELHYVLMPAAALVRLRKDEDEMDARSNSYASTQNVEKTGYRVSYKSKHS
jgi:hypothetical protein